MSEKPPFAPSRKPSSDHPAAAEATRASQGPRTPDAPAEGAEEAKAREALRKEADRARDAARMRLVAIIPLKESLEKAADRAEIFGEGPSQPDRAGRIAELGREIVGARQAIAGAEFMRSLADHPNADIMRILGNRTSFAQLTSSDFQLFAMADIDVAATVLSRAAPADSDPSAARERVDFAKLKKGDVIVANLGPDSKADGSLLLVDLFPDAVTASAIAIDGEPHTYREPPQVDEAGFFRDNAQNLQIPAVVRDGSRIEIVSVSAARAARDREVRAYRDRMGLTAANRGVPLSNREEDRRLAEAFKERQSSEKLRTGFMMHPQYGTAVRVLCSAEALDMPTDVRGGIFTQLLYKESGFRSHIKNPRSSAHGFGQILGDTWKAIEREMLPKYRDRLGLDRLAEAGLLSPQEAAAKPLKLDRRNPVHQLIMSAVYLRAMYDMPKTKDWADAVISYNLPGYEASNFAKVQKAYGRDPANNTYADYLKHRERMKSYYEVTEWKWAGRDKRPILPDDEDRQVAQVPRKPDRRARAAG